MKKKSAFTLIEVLVVSTIIAILATIGLVTYSSAMKKSRDGKRKADMAQIQSALEMYRSDDSAGQYPSSLVNITPDYMQEIPLPPQNSIPSTYQGNYTRLGVGGYRLCQTLETDGSNYCVGNP